MYFKTKDDLLNKLAYDLCDRFTHYVQHGYNETDSLFNRYRKMFENKLAFLRDNPTVATNLSQYQAMLGFNEIIERLIHDDDFIWNKFVRDGQASLLKCLRNYYTFWALVLWWKLLIYSN